MRLARPAPSARPETIVALIDVVFFLLVFFMLIGRMDATAPFAVTPPLGVTGSDMPAGGLTVAVAADGALAVEGEVLDRDALLAHVAERLTAAPTLMIRVNADRAAPLRHVLPLVAAFEEIGASDVVLVVTPDPVPMALQ